MIRVAFVLDLNNTWIGGLNYYRNLLTAIYENKNEIIQPVIFTSNKANDNLFEGFPPIEIIRNSCFDRYSLGWFFQRSGEKVLNHNYILENLFYKYNIKVLSHSDLLGFKSTFPMLGWIPDFQHMHHPEFFTAKDIDNRNQGFFELCKKSTRIILSSYAAQKDLACFAPEYVDKSRVLQFVVPSPQPANKVERTTLEKRYHFEGNYLHLPNQFWIHKNHTLIIEALKIAKLKGKHVHIIATGTTTDYRQPHYYRQLIDLASQYGVIDSFQVLGMVPYSDLLAIMNNSIALINPSLFEGWSTTVEESKSLGKKILLSNIEVHQEQNPERGIFFDPSNPEELADLMWQAVLDYDKDEEEHMRNKALQDIPQRWYQFAKTYENIIVDAIS